MLKRLRCRWFRFAFSLRSLFAVVTLATLPLGWVRNEAAKIDRRRAVLCQVSLDLQRARLRHMSLGPSAPVVLLGTSDDLRWVRAALGHQRHRHMVLPYGQSDKRAIEFTKLFPETTVRCFERTRPEIVPDAATAGR